MKRSSLRANVVLAAVVLLAGVAVSAHAATIEVYPGDPSWVSEGNTGGGSSAITGTFASAGGTGSVEMTGDRTRFVLGSMWATTGTGLGLLSELDSFIFDWAVSSGNTTGPASYTPALRLHIYDPAQTSPDQTRNANLELIWEGAYNGVSPFAYDTWYTTGINDLFWRYEGFVTGTNGGVAGSVAQANLPLSTWATGTDTDGDRWFSDDAVVMAISVGVGGGLPGSGYRAFADNVSITFAGNTTVYDFELAPVPEPATVSLVSLMLGGLALRSYRRRRQ